MTSARPKRSRTDPRRRGAELEDALLRAAWDEVVEVGYADLTMESVAERAQTSRAVLYRRWPDRRELVLAAFRHRAPGSGIETPDTGSFRGDVLALLRSVARRYDQLQGMYSVIMAEYAKDSDLSTYLRDRANQSVGSAMTVILDRAAARGELAPGSLSPRVKRLPVDLLRHELLFGKAAMPIPDEFIVEITDEIFLPLVELQAGAEVAGDAEADGGTARNVVR
ncbi:TetR/AcrR family transcriptional regulator [Actinomadura barringtoniae]|uniref:TetR/AcrR family transcriptional regulator n=1 Tax=Actinomadura barringtoniae TaxID=1427535 RepID=A0A939P7N7_9ACTN|nr:TetR/AcrR family transcriptional regulator [Actinomadura barringtoniae]MBO2447030.1 TetR/AcrR family transcriptional regulator [Actinomadura barringtoniae]